ncbi:hypothetical protein ACFC09_07070 [Streptomyces sp. NPDC056161]|uniref:hypothetical protein n=1 Tax=Streptomyces sp. NPDC056161 TaxID=3345732 RepID=UPI0035D5E010
MPFALSGYLAQVNRVEPDTHGDAVLLPLDGMEPISSAGTFNTRFPHTRQAYVVVETARLGHSDISGAFVGPTPYLCGDPSVVALYGFGEVSDCGTVVATG